jgi:hypothetical protein
MQQKQIRDRVLKFEKFLKENDAKRQRANLKAQTERKTKEAKVGFHRCANGDGCIPNRELGTGICGSP